MRDPLGVLYWPAYAGRDAMRTPMHWRDGPGGGFTRAGVAPWLPLGDISACNVEDQRHDPDSVLTLTHDLIALRRQVDDLQVGGYSSLATPAGTWAWRRGDHHLVAVNLSDREAVLEGLEGRILVGTDRARDDERFGDGLGVGAWEGVVARVP